MSIAKDGKKKAVRKLSL